MSKLPQRSVSNKALLAKVQGKCSRCGGKGTVTKDGPSMWEYDSHAPCPECTTDRTALKGTGKAT